MAVTNDIGRLFQQAYKNIDDVLWKEAGCSSELDYTEQTSWLLFLKYLDDLEQERATEAELEGRTYSDILDPPYRWERWAAPKDRDGRRDHNRALTGDDLVEFVDRKLFPYLHGFRQRASGPDTICIPCSIAPAGPSRGPESRPWCSSSRRARRRARSGTTLVDDSKRRISSWTRFKMNEAETRAEHIDPALKAAGWGVVEGSRILREYPIDLVTKLRLRHPRDEAPLREFEKEGSDRSRRSSKPQSREAELHRRGHEAGAS